MIFVVSYDLSPGILRDVTPFLQELQNTESGRTWWHFLTNTWLIATDETAQQLFARLQAHLKPDDRVLVMGVTQEHSGWLPQEAWKWIQEQASAGAFPKAYALGR